MSDGLIGAQRAVFESALSSTEKLVLLAILDHWSRAEPSPFPGVKRLAACSSLSSRAVLTAIKSLEAKGALRVTRTNGKSNAYDLGSVFRRALPTRRDRCSTFTGEARSPVKQVHATGEAGSPGPVNVVHPKGPSKGPKKEPSRDRARKSKRAAPVPGDWEPTEQHRAFATKHGLDLDLEAIKFRGHWDGKSLTSVNGAFSKWLANAVTYAKRDAARGTAWPMRAAAPISPASEHLADSAAEPLWLGVARA